LIGAAANQIGLAARQANLFAAYRKQTKNLTVLYRISHELSHLLPLEEIFMQAFTIIRDELGLKRLWLGLLNESGNRIIGQAAYGPGWKKKLVEMDVEIGDAKNPLAQVINEKKALIVEDPEKLLGPLLIRKFFAHFSIKTLALAPLIVRGKILGVLAVQPSSTDNHFEEEELVLLSSLANEIANIVLTKRLESKLTETDKMRSVGLLAAGIAHNFNNILQAIMGQASLLEMSNDKQPQVLKSAKIIGESATKGAGLVRQLLSFATFDEPHSQNVQVNDIITEELKRWSAQLSSNQQIKLSLKQELPTVKIDPRHFQRIISSLIANAIESMQEKGGLIQIFSDSVTSEQELIHFEVPLGNYVRVGVRDRGVGMDDETKKRCFEPFFTTKNIDPSSGLGLTGAGLGLASAYALARKNGGRLVVDSRVGHGSVFTFYIPMPQTVKKEVVVNDDNKASTNINPLIRDVSLKNDTEEQ
ncbi:MAG: GAF domain-containing protein, partial [Proteobacteria bacterium]|nr:GAF domain-containing protein [Pseudomonadota bacterium]